MAKKRDFTKIVVYGDVHDPYVDEPVWGMFLEALQVIKPDAVIEIGDGFDFYQVSPFLKDPARANDLAKDRDTFLDRRAALNGVLKANKKPCLKRYLPGNHELWLRKYLWSHAPELSSLPELEWYEFLGLSDLGWDYIDFQGVQQPVLDVGKLAVTHGHIARKPLGASIRWMLDEMGQSVLFGHTHRMGWLPSSNARSDYAGFENGCLCTKQVGEEYVKGAIRWQQGFSVVTLQESTGMFRVHPIQVLRDSEKQRKSIMLHEKVLECSV